ncbi:aspartate aminotransferase family protein [Pseudarthrobacter sp. O4]|uniref:aspartate aminotransferase family protein n=1 Tax=Pseudarthrobacter sp. O4 TaxID=3418417 RepID=UPI003CEC8E55
MTTQNSLLVEQWQAYRGEGVRLFDGALSYIDCASGTFNLSLGYSNAEVTSALHEQIDRCSHLSSDLTQAKTSAIFESLKDFLPPHIAAFWFRDIIGSSATECAIRIAQKATGRSGIVSLFLSHHGQTVGAAGVSGNAFRQASFTLPFVGSLKIPAPDCLNCFYEKTPDSCNMLCARRLDDFLEYASNGQVAAVIIEPVLGNGGNIVPPPDYFKTLREVCDQNKILIIADEVQTGFGRTGTFFASNGFAKDLRPDIITFGKGAGGVGIPAAGVVMRAELDVLEPWEHSTTSGANPLALAAMEATIAYIKNHQVLQNVQVAGAALKQGLHELETEFPIMRNVRGVGLMLGFDLPNSETTSLFISIAKSHGLILRGSRYGFGHTIKVRPPLIISNDEVDEILVSLRSALADLSIRKTA